MQNTFLLNLNEGSVAPMLVVHLGKKLNFGLEITLNTSV